MIDDLGIVLEVDRLRRERHELVGELAVTCRLAGAHVIGDDDLIHLADLNLSSAAARTARAKMLRDRSETELDWASWLERLCVQAIRAERTGTPSRPLQDYELRAEEPNFSIKGWELPRHHAAILFGDGGSLKSYLALYAAGMLVEQHGLTVLYCDWELDGEDHRERLHALFGGDAPTLHYLRCDRALVEETERIRREVGRLGVDYLICDSVGFATPGPPESAEMATGYFRAVRQIGIGGSLHLAHVVKAASTDENKKRFRGLKPFGSAFWSNSARSNWFVRRADDDERTRTGLSSGCTSRK